LAIKDAYKLFKAGGYNGSQQEFLNLISTNSDARKDAFNLFSSAGYSGGETGFSGLLGLSSFDKKKEESALPLGQGSTLSDTPETEPQKPSAFFVKGKIKTPSTFNKNVEDSDFKRHQDLYRSAKKSIDSGDRQAFLQSKKKLDDLRKSYGDVMANDSNLSEDYNLLNSLSEEKFKQEKKKELRFIQEEERVPVQQTQKKQLEKSIKGYESDVKYTPEERVTMLEIQRDLLESVDYDGIGKEVSDEYSAYSMKPIYTKIGMLSVPQVEGSANDAIKMAVDELVAAGKEPNKDAVLERASEIRTEEVKNKREYEAIDDKYKFSSILGKSEDQKEKEQALQGIKKKRESHAEMFKSKVGQLEALESQIKQYEDIAKEQGELSDVERSEALDVFNRYKRLSTDIVKNYSNIENDTENIGDFDTELDAFKRNHTYLTSASAKSLAALERIGGGIAGTAGMVNNIAYDLTGNAEFYLRANDLLGIGKSIEDSAQGMLDGVSKSKQLEDIKDAGDAIEWAGALMVENTPQILINVLTNGQAIPFLAASSAGEKYMEVYGEENYSDLQKYAASILVGGGTAISEKLELAAFSKLWPSKRLAKAAIESSGRKAFEKSLSDGVRKGISDVFSRSKNALAGVNQEGVSEIADQLSRNLVDKYVLDKEDVSITDGLGEAYLSGAVVGAGLGAAPHVFSSIVRPFVNDPDRDIIKNVNKIQKLSESLEKADEKMKPIIQERIGQLRGRNEAIIQKAVNSFDSLTPSEVKEAVNIYEDITSLKKEYLDIKEDTTIPPDVKEALLESVFTKYNSLVERRLQILKKAEDNAVQEQTTSEVPAQPEAAVGEEVAQGATQAEPEVVTEQGKEEVAAEEQIDLFKLDDTEYELGDDGKWYNAETLEEIDEETTSRVKSEAKPSKKIPKRGSKGTIAGVKVTYPTMQEARERKAARNEAKYVEDSSENLEEENTQALTEDLQGEFGILTAENPMAQPLTEQENTQLNEKAEEWLKEKGYKPRRVTGKYNQAENSFFVKGLTKEDAIAFAKKFNQDSVAHSEGLVYQDGAMNPRVKSDDNFTFGEFTPESNFVSVIKTKDGLRTFEIGYDFDTKTAPSTTTKAETGKQQTLAAEQGTPTTIEGTGLRENIKKSIAKVFKSFEVKSFKNAKEMAAYAKAKFKEETGPEDAARVFAGSDGVVEVLVNEELADDTALGHEVWHALLLKAFGDDQARFAEFRGAIDKALRENGYDEAANSLDEFSSRYTEEGEVPAEEYLAQLGGLMTSAKIDLKNLTPAQKTLLEQIKDIINEFAIKLTGQPVFLKDATAETILDFMSTMSDMMAKGEDISGFFEGVDKTTEAKSRSQKAAIEILDGPKFDNKLKEDVASYLNSLRDSEIPPNSSREQLMERFINNVYEEVGYYLFSKPDARSAGLTWYIEDMVEFENKVKVIVPELSNEKQYKLFLSILAFTSSGTNPNQNLSYAYNLWNNSNDPKNFEFSKDWGDKKLSFVDKKGKAVASGVIVKETAKEYTVELVDSLGRPEVDSKGNKKYEKISKASMKPGYPKSTGYTNRGKIIVGQLEKLEKLYADLKSIDAVVEWLETPHPIAELRKYNEAVPDVNGKGPGKTNKKYDPSKNADGERNGAFIFGEKIGSFYQNMIGIGETITMDLWWSRTWNRYMGTMINTTSGNKEIQEVPRSDRERNIMREAVKMVAEDLNLQVSELQAAIWYFEQELWTKSGNASPSYSYVTAIDELTEKLKVDEETRTKLRAAEADLTEAEKRRKNAAERAAAVVASKGGEIPKVKVTTRAQKSVPDVVDEVLTDDGKGNYVFIHYSDERRKTIKPMSGSNKGFTSREEVAAISSVGGVAMYYTKRGQTEQGVGDVPHTVLVPKDKVYFYGTTERGKVSHDIDNFYPEARRRFQEYKNRNNPGKPTEFAFDSDNSAAWVGKVAEENGYDMLVTNWGGPKSYRAQSVKELTPETEYTQFKEIPEPVFEVGDEVFLYGRYSIITDVDPKVLTYKTENAFGSFDTGKFPNPMNVMTRDKIIMIKKAKPSTTTRAQKANPKTIPGYDRMISQVNGIITKSNNRGLDKVKITENVLNYIQKSAVYERADDLQREQIVRDAIKELGLRQKSAPSVDRLLGKIKDIKKVTVTEKSALKELLKAEAKGARTAVQARSQAAKALNDILKKLEKKGSIKATQVRAIMTRYSKVNFFSSSSMDNFVNYMAKVFSDAEYNDKLKTASKTANSVRRLIKNASLQAGTKAVAKKFLEIDPRLVEDIDKYLEFAKALNEAVRTSTSVTVDGDIEVILKKAIDYNEFQDYMDAQILAQEEYIKNQLAEIHKDLVDAGVIDTSMSLADMKAIIDAINSEDSNTLPSEEKERMIRAYLGSVMDSYTGLIQYMLDNSMDPFSLELVSISQSDRDVISRFINMDLNKLPLKDAYSVVEAIENFIVNKNVDNMGSILAVYEGAIEAEKLQKAGTKTRPVRSFFSKRFGLAWAEQIEQLQITMERMFGGVNAGIKVMRASGILDISQGKTKATIQSEKILKKYTDKFGKVKEFSSAENIFERKIISFMKRTINGSDIQRSIEFERRKRIIEETIDAMENGSELERRDAAIARKVYDKVLKDAKTPTEVSNNASDINNEAVDFWIEEFENIFDELQSVSRSVYNTILERDLNYTPDRFTRFDGNVDILDITSSSFAVGNETYNTNKSGTLMVNNRIKTLGAKPSRVLSFDFDSDMSNAMLNALIDINTAYAIRKVKGFYESDSFEKIVGNKNKEDLQLIKKRVKSFITKTKRKEYVPQSELSNAMKGINLLSQIAVGRALGSLAQIPKQTISVMANTMINSDGKLSFIDVINAKEFIDNSGYSIALRGIASNADLQNINKILERESESNAQEIQRGLNKAAEMWLNSFIARPDVWAARVSWITYYKESLRKQGIDADNIDWSTHEMNQKAGDYAQAQVNRQQNYSDSDFAGDLLGSKDPMKAYFRKILFPYMTFVFNQKSRQIADIATLSNKAASTEDKKIARKSLAGLAAEIGMYSLVGYFVKEVYAAIVNAVTGDEDEEEDKDKRLSNHLKYTAKTTINDLFSPVPNITDDVLESAINKLIKISDLDEKKFSIPESQDKSLVEMAMGQSFIIKEGMLNLERMSYAAATGTAIGEYKGTVYERQLSKEDQDLMKYVSVVYGAYLLGGVPADFGRLSEKVYRKLLKDSKKEKGSGGGGIKTTISTKIK
jgi:hypothetical protein